MPVALGRATLGKPVPGGFFSEGRSWRRRSVERPGRPIKQNDARRSVSGRRVLLQQGLSAHSGFDRVQMAPGGLQQGERGRNVAGFGAVGREVLRRDQDAAVGDCHAGDAVCDRLAEGFLPVTEPVTQALGTL